MVAKNRCNPKREYLERSLKRYVLDGPLGNNSFANSLQRQWRRPYWQCRDRIETVPPVLTYGREFFERFEPLTVGDYERVPSVTFLSDVLEFDAIRLRGLDPGYSQVLINGRKAPGSEADRSSRRPHPGRADRPDRDRA